MLAGILLPTAKKGEIFAQVENLIIKILKRCYVYNIVNFDFN